MADMVDLIVAVSFHVGIQGRRLQPARAIVLEQKPRIACLRFQVNLQEPCVSPTQQPGRRRKGDSTMWPLSSPVSSR